MFGTTNTNDSNVLGLNKIQFIRYSRSSKFVNRDHVTLTSSTAKKYD